MARILIVVGLVLVAVGLLIKFGVPIGRLPGDIVIEREHGTIYIPIVTCLVLSVILSVVFALLRRS
jgi:hypothetical protein